VKWAAHDRCHALRAGLLPPHTSRRNRKMATR
jgi:hypothetical protein